MKLKLKLKLKLKFKVRLMTQGAIMSKGQTLQDPYLNVLRKERVPVSIFLVMVLNCRAKLSLSICL